MPSSMTKLLAALALSSAAGLTAANMPVPAQAQETPTSPTADEQMLVFRIENMTCALCPVTVKKAMARVKGVRSVDVDFAAKTATVVFDPAATSAAEIAEASSGAGYPAEPAG